MLIVTNLENTEKPSTLLWCHKSGAKKITCSISNQAQQRTSGCLGGSKGRLVAEQVPIHKVISLQ